MEPAKLSAIAGGVSHLLLSALVVFLISASLHHLRLVCTQLLQVSPPCLPWCGGCTGVGCMLRGSREAREGGAVGFGGLSQPLREAEPCRD